jgi:hypothetical protein
MTEEQWLSCSDPQPMLEFLRGRVGDRKQRLFACACCHRVWDSLADPKSRSAVGVAERYADGVASREELAAAERAAEAVAFAAARTREELPPDVTQAALAAVGEQADATIWAAWAASEATPAPREERRQQCDLVRDLFGPSPFRRVTVDPAWLAWNAGTVRRLAEAAYEQRALPDGTLDTARLAVLADALEEAGCGDAELLGHLRGPGPHYRGCFAVDAILDRE